MMRKGPLAWMVDHGVAPNLMMVLFIVGGLMASMAIKKEVFPEFETEIVQVSISYPCATPEDIEQSLLLPMEAAIANVEGIDEMTASASEGSGVVSATLIDGVDVMRAYQDIQQAVNAITTLPAAADLPRITLAGRSRSVVSLQVYGRVGRKPCTTPPRTCGPSYRPPAASPGRSSPATGTGKSGAPGR